MGSEGPPNLALQPTAYSVTGKSIDAVGDMAPTAEEMVNSHIPNMKTFLRLHIGNRGRKLRRVTVEEFGTGSTCKMQHLSSPLLANLKEIL
jgi:hypothetical protein